MNEVIYLDYAASTPLDESVAEAMDACARSPAGTGNASADHAWGRAAAEAAEVAAGQVATLIGAAADEIIWTSGATESDNLAVIGAAMFRSRQGRHVITVATEHPAVLQSCHHLEQLGFDVTYLQPDSEGLLSVEQLATAIRPDTTLASIMHANNETGVVQDIGSFGALCRERGVLLHVDAAQSAGRLPIDVRAQSIDLLSLSAHKLYGPKGIGALFLDRQRCRRVEPLLHGGGQQRGLRPSTLPVPSIVGMGRAFELARQRQDQDVASAAGLRDRLWSQLESVDGVLLNGSRTRRVCHILNVSVTGVHGESLRCGLRELAVSAGSACSTDSGEPSAVLRSLGRSDTLAQASIRFSVGRGTTAADIDRAVAIFQKTVERLRRIAPLQRSVAG